MWGFWWCILALRGLPEVRVCFPRRRLTPSLYYRFGVGGRISCSADRFLSYRPGLSSTYWDRVTQMKGYFVMMSSGKVLEL